MKSSHFYWYISAYSLTSSSKCPNVSSGFCCFFFLFFFCFFLPKQVLLLFSRTIFGTCPFFVHFFFYTSFNILCFHLLIPLRNVFFPNFGSPFFLWKQLYRFFFNSTSSFRRNYFPWVTMECVDQILLITKKKETKVNEILPIFFQPFPRWLKARLLFPRPFTPLSISFNSLQRPSMIFKGETRGQLTDEWARRHPVKKAAQWFRAKEIIKTRRRKKKTILWLIKMAHEITIFFACKRTH